jgi:pyruvate/2-oxoglutarate dehydrogenase complex dihydrolipoamide acyltransferase (E2) component
MSTPVLLPKLGFSVSEATVVEWLVSDGAHIQEGKPLYSLESDKSVQEIESPATGQLKILAEAGGTYPVGTVIGEIQ